VKRLKNPSQAATYIAAAEASARGACRARGIGSAGFTYATRCAGGGLPASCRLAVLAAIASPRRASRSGGSDEPGPAWPRQDPILSTPRRHTADDHSDGGRPDASFQPGGRPWFGGLGSSRAEGRRAAPPTVELADANAAGNLAELADLPLQSSASISRSSAPAKALTRVALVTLWAR